MHIANASNCTVPPSDVDLAAWNASIAAKAAELSAAGESSAYILYTPGGRGVRGPDATSTSPGTSP